MGLLKRPKRANVVDIAANKQKRAIWWGCGRIGKGVEHLDIGKEHRTNQISGKWSFQWNYSLQWDQRRRGNMYGTSLEAVKPLWGQPMQYWWWFSVLTHRLPKTMSRTPETLIPLNKTIPPKGSIPPKGLKRKYPRRIGKKIVRSEMNRHVEEVNSKRSISQTKIFHSQQSTNRKDRSLKIVVQLECNGANGNSMVNWKRKTK